MRRGTDPFIAKRLAGDRIVGKRHRDLGQPGRQLAAVLGGVESEGLDVPEQGDPLVDARLGAADG
jgi:hypothetical protein